MILTQPPLNSLRGQKNVENSPSSKFKCIKPSMMNATVEHNKVKKDVLNKTKDELRKLESKFKSMCSSINDDCAVSNWNVLVTEMFNSLVNPTFIQHIKSIIDRDQSGDDKLKLYEVVQHTKALTVPIFYQATLTSFLIIIMVILSLKMKFLDVCF